MELELVRKKDSQVKKLEKMKDLLSQNQLVKSQQFKSAMGSELEERKMQHKEMMDKQLERLMSDQKSHMQRRLQQQKTLRDGLAKSARSKDVSPAAFGMQKANPASRIR